MADIPFHLYKSKLVTFFNEFDNIKDRGVAGNRTHDPETNQALRSITYFPSTMRSRRHKEKVQLTAVCYKALCFRPTCEPVDHGQHVLVAMRFRKWAHQIDMDMVKTSSRWLELMQGSLGMCLDL